MLAVRSHPCDFVHRNLVRSTWGSGGDVDYVFILGVTPPSPHSEYQTGGGQSSQAGAWGQSPQQSPHACWRLVEDEAVAHHDMIHVSNSDVDAYLGEDHAVVDKHYVFGASDRDEDGNYPHPCTTIALPHGRFGVEIADAYDIDLAAFYDCMNKYPPNARGRVCCT